MNDAERREFLEEARGSRVRLTVPVPPGYSPSEVAACFLGSLLEELDAELNEYELLPDGVRATIRPRDTSSARGNTKTPEAREQCLRRFLEKGSG